MKKANRNKTNNVIYLWIICIIDKSNLIILQNLNF